MILNKFFIIVLDRFKLVWNIFINFYINVKYYILCESYRIILVGYILFMVSFTILSVLFSLYMMVDSVLSIVWLETSNVLALSYSVDYVSVSDISDIMDQTDIIDYLDYIYFVDSIDVVQEKSWISQYFDEFIKLFRKDRVSNGVVRLEYNTEIINLGIHNIDSKYKSSDTYIEVLRRELIDSNQMCLDLDETSKYFQREVEEYAEDLKSVENIVEAYQRDIIAKDRAVSQLKTDLIAKDSAVSQLKTNLASSERERLSLEKDRAWWRNQFLDIWRVWRLSLDKSDIPRDISLDARNMYI